MRQRQISEFEIEDTLGVGTVGTIYRAFDKENDVDVALKRLHPAVSADPLIAARFEREMLVLEKLSHPHIVRYFGGGRDGEQLFFAMELVDGGSLKELLQSTGRLTWAEAASVGAQIASALQHSHNHGIIHRDLKPANLFLTKEGELKLGDFGIARDTREADLTSSGLTVGTYAYMSPEQIIGDKEISGKADLYALGCLLFELLTGEPPFEGANFAQLFEQHLRHQPPGVRQFAPGIPEDMESLLQELLEKDPEKRPFNARAVQGRLYALLDEVQPQSDGNDVAADAVKDPGQQLLARRLRHSLKNRVQREASWRSLAIIFGLISLVLLVLLIWSQRN